MTAKKWYAFFDGSAIPNPGLRKIGGFVKDEKGNILFEYSKNIGHGTNNEAEYESLIHLLSEIKNRHLNNIEIKGDSALVINQINGKWKVKNPKIGLLYQVCIDYLYYIPSWKLSHVPRTMNKQADQLTR